MIEISSKNSLTYCIGYYYTFVNPMGTKKECLAFCRKYKKINDIKKFNRICQKEIDEL